MTKTKMYVSYGSNMDLTQMMERCPGAQLMGKGTLIDHTLVFRQSCTGFYASIDCCKESSVPVIVWKLGYDNEEKLDMYEGYPNYYQKKTVKVETENHGIIEVMTYYLPEENLLGLPSQEYFRKIEAAYEKFGFNRVELKKAYVKSLKENLDSLHSGELTTYKKQVLIDNLINTAIEHKGAYIWSAGDYRRMPREGVYDFVKTPTAMAWGFMAFASDAIGPEINYALVKAEAGCRICGLRGHGYEAAAGYDKLAGILGKCGIDMKGRW